MSLRDDIEYLELSEKHDAATKEIKWLREALVSEQETRANQESAMIAAINNYAKWLTVTRDALRGLLRETESSEFERTRRGPITNEHGEIENQGDYAQRKAREALYGNPESTP